ncbi:hypothetical protein [Vulcanisaeta sp. JCM 14467]
MGFGSRLLALALVIVVIIVVAAAALLITYLPRVLINHGPTVEVSGVTYQGVIKPSLAGLSVSIYVVGSSVLVQRLVGLGINQSLIKFVTISELPSLPNGSVVVIDWSLISPGLIINRSGTIYVNTSSANFRLVSGLIGRGDFLIVHGNASDVPAIELVLTTAWSRAFNTSVAAMPVPRSLSGLGYVVAYGNSHALIIGPHSLGVALGIALTMKEPTMDPTGGDLCMELATSIFNQPSRISSTEYVIAYGPQSYGDSFGIFIVDFCTVWSTVLTNDLNGASAGYAEFYNYINYIPNFDTQIEYLKTFQDGYASYVVYEYGLGKVGESQLPGDAQYIAGSGEDYKPGYWTNTAGFEPRGVSCTPSTTYTINLATGSSATSSSITVSSSTSQTYSCQEYTISVYGNPGTVTTMKIGTVNQTWIFTPQATQYAEEEQAYGVESQGYTYMGPAYNPQPTAYTIPVGALVIVNNTSIPCRYYLLGFIPISGATVEYVAYGVDWDVWVNVNGWVGGLTGFGPGLYVRPSTYGPALNSTSGFYHVTYCRVGFG